jgi:cation diffusion facilitator family transporter
MDPGPPTGRISHTVPVPDDRRRKRLIRVISLSIVTAVVTISMKTGAWLLTGSVGLLSDAAESVVNLVAALVALTVILWSTRPPDEDHAYGHEKADYLSAGFEGALIVLAAATIAYAAIGRLIDPAGLTDVGAGLAVSLAATLINLVVGRYLISTGKKEQSMTVEADGQHLMTDVWTSLGVVAGVALVYLTGWERLDPVIALLVAANIVRTGVRLMRGSMSGLMDRALTDSEIDAVNAVLRRHASESISFHALRTRRSGRRAFVSVHVLVPGHWTVQRGHDFAEGVEEEMRASLDQVTVFTHLEPIEDPLSFDDTELDRGPSFDSPH